MDTVSPTAIKQKSPDKDTPVRMTDIEPVIRDVTDTTPKELHQNLQLQSDIALDTQIDKNTLKFIKLERIAEKDSENKASATKVDILDPSDTKDFNYYKEMHNYDEFDIPQGMTNQYAVEQILKELRKMIMERETNFDSSSTKKKRKVQLFIKFIKNPNTVFTLLYVILTAFNIDYKLIGESPEGLSI